MPPEIIAAVGAGFVLILVHALPWMRRTSPALVHSPAKLLAALSAVQVLPHYFVVIIWPEESMIYSLMGAELEGLLTKFALFYSLGMVALLYGIHVGSRGRAEAAQINVTYEPNYYFASFFAFIVYLISMYLIITQNFDFVEFISSAGTQRELESGTGFLYILKTPASYLAILFIAIQHARTGKPKFWILIGYVILIVLIEATLGSRRTPIQLIIFAIVAVHMVRPDRALFSTSNILLGLVCATIFVVLLNFRYQAMGMMNPGTITSYIVNFSYNDIYMFVIHHFSYNDFWYGKVFLDFTYRFTGGIQNLGPPPIDEGVYIYNLFLGQPVEPPLPTELMAANSWPPRTFGNGFMNFGLPGVVVFSFIQGWMIGLAFKFMLRTNRHPIFLFFFLLLVFSFQVSNLKIAELGSVLVGLTLIFGPLYLAERRSVRAANSSRIASRWPHGVGPLPASSEPHSRDSSHLAPSAFEKDS